MSRRTLALGAGLAVAGHLAPAALWLPRLRAALAPALDGSMPAGTVAVTFDDGPHPHGTPAVLDALDRLGWTATFFVLGSQARRHPELVTETQRRGHHVALHGDEHRYLIARSPWAAAADLRRAYSTVGELLGAAPLLWRPPYGVLSGPALAAARTLGLRPVLWSAWGKDWRADATAHSVARQVGRGRVAGGTVLLHDSDVTSAPGSWQAAVAALPLLAEQWARAGVRVQPLGMTGRVD